MKREDNHIRHFLKVAYMYVCLQLFCVNKTHTHTHAYTHARAMHCSGCHLLCGMEIQQISQPSPGGKWNISASRAAHDMKISQGGKLRCGKIIIPSEDDSVFVFPHVSNEILYLCGHVKDRVSCTTRDS